MIKYRKANTQDISQIMDIKFRSTPHLSASGWGWDPVVEVAYYQKHFRPETYTIIISQDQIVGYFSIYQIGSGLLCLEALVIDATCQRKGMGKKVLTDLIEMANLESNQMELTVQKNNPGAKIFYEKYGFEIFSDSLTHYKMRYDPCKKLVDYVE